VAGVFLKRKYLILTALLLALVGAGTATYFTTPLYRSFALIEITPEPVRVHPYRDVADFTSPAPNYELYMKTQEQILRSPSLVIGVEKSLEARTGRTANLSATHLEIQRIENSQLFRISYLAATPQQAADLVDAYAEEYIKQQYQGRQAARERARQLLEGELKTLEERVQLSEKEMLEYARGHRMLSLQPGQVDLVQQKLAILAQQVADADAVLITAGSRLESLRKASVTDFPERLATSVIFDLNGKILQGEAELAALRARFGEKWPALVQKRNELVLLRQQLDSEKSAALARALEQAQMEYRSAEITRRMLTASLAEHERVVNRFHDASIEYNILRREVDTNQKLYEGLLERLKQTSVTAGLEFGNIRVVEAGRPDPRPYSPQLWWNLALAALAGLAFGVCLALLADFWDVSLTTLDQAERFTLLPALGVVPKIPEHHRKSLPAPALKQLRGLPGDSAAHSPNGLPPDASEAVRSICASILLSRSDSAPRIIMVTSTFMGEGKTTLVYYLGRAFAESGCKTLLVEADMRKPALSAMFGIGSENGLSLFLAGHTPPPSVHEIQPPNLSLVAAGPKAPNPVALLNSDRLSNYLKELTGSYRFVIIDAPPLLAVADARILAPKTDGVVLVIQAGRTPKEHVRRASDLLRHPDVNLLGFVLNGTDPRSDSYYYRHYYQD
jgi:polysaccharide biosynthesis transport protein